ncbi:hypothetical protein ACFWHW_36580 [Streptomyces pharetrae]
MSAAVTGTTLATAGTASAASYSCKTSSSGSYDDPGDALKWIGAR